MERYNCTCHCGGSMFYKHLHDPSCDLFMHGEEAPQSKEAQLQAALDAERARVKELEADSDTWKQAAYDQADAHKATQSQLQALKVKAEQDAQLATLQAQLRQVEGDRQTLRQLVAALPVVDVQEVSVWLSPDESGWLVSKRPAFPAGLYWAKFRTQAEADSFRALLAYRATLVVQDAPHPTEEAR